VAEFAAPPPNPIDALIVAADASRLRVTISLRPGGRSSALKTAFEPMSRVGRASTGTTHEKRLAGPV
jgi:hypothetical protein